MNLEDYKNQLEEPILKEQTRVNSILSMDLVKEAAEERWNRLISLIDDGNNEEWKKIIPGRVICHKFSSLAGIDPGRFKTMYINQAKEEGLTPFEDITNIFRNFDLLSS